MVYASLAVIIVFFGGLTGGLVAVFRRLERDQYATTGRRKLARGSFGVVAAVPLTLGLVPAIDEDGLD